MGISLSNLPQLPLARRGAALSSEAQRVPSQSVGAHRELPLN